MWVRGEGREGDMEGWGRWGGRCTSITTMICLIFPANAASGLVGGVAPAAASAARTKTVISRVEGRVGSGAIAT